MCHARNVHGFRRGPEFGLRIVNLRAGQHTVAAKPARDQHLAIGQKRGRMLVPRRVQRKPFLPLSARRIKDLGARGIGKAAGHQHQPAGQQRGGVQFARDVERAGVRPPTAGRIVNLRLPEHLAGGLAAGHHHAAIRQQSHRVKFPSQVQWAGVGPGRGDGIVKLRSRRRRKRRAAHDQHFPIQQQRGRVLPPELTHGPDQREGTGRCGRNGTQCYRHECCGEPQHCGGNNQPF